MGQQLVDEMGDESGGGVAQNLCPRVGSELGCGQWAKRTTHFIIPLEGLSELPDQPVQHQLLHLQELHVDDGDQHCKDGHIWQGHCLRLHHAPHKEALPPDQVLREQLWNDMLDIRHIHPVHDPSD